MLLKINDIVKQILLDKDEFYNLLGDFFFWKYVEHTVRNQILPKIITPKIQIYNFQISIS